MRIFGGKAWRMDIILILYGTLCNNLKKKNGSINPTWAILVFNIDS